MINVKNNLGQTPLLYSLLSDNKIFAKKLIQNKADVNISDNEKLTPLYYARIKGWTKLVELLKKNGAIDRNIRPKLILLAGHTDSLTTFSFSPTEDYLITGSSDNTT